jgi:membrane protease YdiL (CAAX protease family)
VGRAAAVCALWHFENRDWGLLLLTAPMSWRFLAGAAVAGALLLLLGFQHVHTLRRARNDPTQPVSFGSPVLDAMVPRSRGENHLFALVAVAAGICEELLFRGFLLVLLASWVGLPAGAALSIVLFGLCHAYQGAAGIVRTSAFAAIATALALGSGSLIPVMIVHAAVDLSVGDLAFRLLGEGRVERVAA